MEALPPEILSEIVQSLTGHSSIKLSAYASISRAWQGAVERQTFCKLTIETADFDTFQSLCASGNVCRARNLTLLDIDFARKPDERSDIRSDTDAFSEDVARLFTLLADIAGQASDLPPLTLQFFMNDFDHENFKSFDLVLSETVPLLPQVNTFKLFGAGKMSVLRRTAASTLLTKLPNVQNAQLGFWDPTELSTQKRRTERQHLGDAVCGFNIPSLTELNMKICTTILQDEDRKPDFLLSNDGAQLDPYIRALHHLATLSNLKTIRLTGPLIISPNMLSNLPNFPVLSDFQLDFATETADSRWFFVKDEELFNKIKEEQGNEGPDENEESEIVVEIYEDDSDLASESESESESESDADEEGPRSQGVMNNNFYRTLPNPELVPSLLLDAARFVEASTRLRRFILRHKNTRSEEGIVHWNHDSMDRHLEIWFVKKGMLRSSNGAVTIPSEEKFLNDDRLYWRVGNWRPDDDVVGAWNKATGPDAKVFFLKEECWEPWKTTWPVYLGDLEDDLVR